MTSYRLSRQHARSTKRPSKFQLLKIIGKTKSVTYSGIKTFAVFHCQMCKFVGFFLPSSSGLLKLSESEILRKQGDAVLQNTKRATEYGLKVKKGKRRVLTISV